MIRDSVICNSVIRPLPMPDNPSSNPGYAKSFRELTVYKKSRELSRAVFKQTPNHRITNHE